MSIDLSALRIVECKPELIDFGGLLEPVLGGEAQRIDRPGSRWAMTFETPTRPDEPDGRIWSARIARAVREGAIISIPQPGFNVGNPGSPVVAGSFVGGRLIQLSGVTPGYPLREGQWVSLRIGGRRYADKVANNASATADGLLTVELTNLLRKPLAGGEVCEIADPKIEGWLRQNFSWSINVAWMTSFSFTIGEAA